jgi:Tfp pilus assembly protein PilE
MNRMHRVYRGDVVGGESQRGGFATVELVAVVVIIGLVAQVAIPRLLEHRGNPSDAAAESLLRSAAHAMEVANSSTRDYAAVTTVQLHAIAPAITFQLTAASAASHQVQVTVTANGYSLDATSKSGSSFDYTRDLTMTPPVTQTLRTDRGINRSW